MEIQSKLNEDALIAYGTLKVKTISRQIEKVVFDYLYSCNAMRDGYKFDLSKIEFVDSDTPRLELHYIIENVEFNNMLFIEFSEVINNYCKPLLIDNFDTVPEESESMILLTLFLK